MVNGWFIPFYVTPLVPSRLSCSLAFTSLYLFLYTPAVLVAARLVLLEAWYWNGFWSKAMMRNGESWINIFSLAAATIALDRCMGRRQ